MNKMGLEHLSHFVHLMIQLLTIRCSSVHYAPRRSLLLALKTLSLSMVPFACVSTNGICFPLGNIWKLAGADSEGLLSFSICGGFPSPVAPSSLFVLEVLRFRCFL